MKKTGKTNEVETNAQREALTDAASQRDCFAEGVKYFTAGNFEAAREIFERAAGGPSLSVTESATMYLRMAERRLEKTRQAGATGEQEFALGKDLLKQKRHGEALLHLEAAVRTLDSAELHYALALTNGHMGDAGAAARHFRRAIELAPESRTTALKDPDFRILLQFAEIRDAASDPRG